MKKYKIQLIIDTAAADAAAARSVKGQEAVEAAIKRRGDAAEAQARREAASADRLAALQDRYLKKE